MNKIAWKNPEERKEYQKKWNEKNRDKILQKRRERYRTDGGKRLLANRIYAKKNRDKRNAKCRTAEYREKQRKYHKITYARDRDKIRERVKLYALNNKDKVKEQRKKNG